MKCLILVMFFFVSCASYAPKTYKQNCAQKGMVLAGVTESNSSTSFYNFNNHSNVYANSYGEAVSCVVPKNEMERCEIEVENRVLKPINEYNSSVGTKKLLNGIAYGVYIIPGIVSKLYYDNALENALEKSEVIRNSLAGSCSSKERIPASHKKVPSDNILRKVDEFLDEEWFISHPSFEFKW